VSMLPVVDLGIAVLRKGGEMRLYCSQCKKRTQHRLGNLGEFICKLCGCWRAGK